MTSCTLHVPESGSWVLDVDHDLPTGVPSPTGKVPCVVGKTPFLGTIDKEASGVFGTRARSRVVGAIEWRSKIRKQDFANPGGVMSNLVISATAAELGIAAVVVVPELLGDHYTRVEGEASQVLGRSGWWVDPVGITTVGPRLPSVPGLDFFLSEYDPLSRIAKVTSSAPIMPGMIVPDLRLPGGAMRVREVTQTWDENGASASLWMGEIETTTAQGPRLANAIQNLALSAMRPELLTHYAYTVVGQSPDGGYLLQAAVLGLVPDAVDVIHWPGVPGFSCKVTPGTKVLVGFRGKEPVVVGFDGTPPLECTWDYLVMKLGGELAKPTVNEDILDAVIELIGKVNGAIPGVASYPTFAADVVEIKGKLALLKTRSA